MIYSLVFHNIFTHKYKCCFRGGGKITKIVCLESCNKNVTPHEAFCVRSFKNRSFNK